MYIYMYIYICIYIIYTLYLAIIGIELINDKSVMYFGGKTRSLCSILNFKSGKLC